MAVAAGLVAAPTSASAADPAIRLPINQIDPSGARTSQMVGNDWLESTQCVIHVPSFIRLYPPAADGSMLIQMEGVTFTRKVRGSADVWHFYLDFYDSAGNFVISTPHPLDGAKMTKANVDYVWDRYQTTGPISLADFNRIGQVNWHGLC